MKRRGVTVLELLVGLVLLTLLASAGVALVRAAARSATLASRQLAGERGATAFVMLLDHDLRHGARSDVTVSGPAVLEFDRPVGEGVVCGLAAGAPLVRVASWRGARGAAAGRDELLLLATVRPATWLRRQMVGSGAGNCPDGAAAVRLDPDLPVASATWVRVVEPTRLRRYASGGAEWLGLEHRWNGTAIQPFAGPVDSVTATWSLVAQALAVTFGPVVGIAATLHLPLE